MALPVGDILFIDTNVFLTATDESRPQHWHATQLLGRSARHHLRLAISGQILREYLVVATRPVDVNGLGLDVRDATANVNEFLRRLDFYDETETVSEQLCRLARIHDLRGKRIHDANIVATMMTHGIRALVTQNPEDFAPFDEITIVDMTEVVGRR